MVEPSRKRGYEFEDEALVDEMVSTVEGVRGALPLLAFAVARLWEKRNRQRRLLTREAYRDIAGVEGALAQHAEATMDRIGPERQGLVREIFRNLVTAQGTRAVMDREELLSAFPDRAGAEDVLRQLIDARLLTTYEVEGREGEASHHRVEVVHESLLRAWPRLVRWQAQDEEGAVLRDQLRQAAHLWEEKGRTSDLLWTGTACTEYELWRSRYPGALTALEEDFARSMAEKARRKRRLVRAVVTAVVLASAAVSITIAVSRHRAVVAARRAEASKLLALAELRLPEDPTEALAFATASLEVDDTHEARAFAMRTLADSPPASELVGGELFMRYPVFSPDGKWLATAGNHSEVRVWSEDGRDPLILPGHQASGRSSNRAVWVSNDLLATGAEPMLGSRVYLWSLPEGGAVRTIDFGGPSHWQVGPGLLLAETLERGSREERVEGVLRSWALPDGDARILGRADWKRLGARWSFFAPDGSRWIYVRDGDLFSRPLPAGDGSDRLLTRLGSKVSGFRVLDSGEVLVWNEDGETRVLSSPPGREPELRIVARPETAPPTARPEPSGRWLTGEPSQDRQARLWDLAAWPAARPWALRCRGSWYGATSAFHPTGDWLVASTGNFTSLTFWPLRRRLPFVVDGYSGLVRPVAFSPDGRWLASSWGNGRLRLWPLPGSGVADVRELRNPELEMWTSIAFHPGGESLFTVGFGDHAWVVPLNGAPRRLEAFSNHTLLYSAALSPSGRLAATARGFGEGPRTLRVWDLETGRMRLFDLPVGQTAASGEDGPRRAPRGEDGGVASVGFADDTTLYTTGDAGLLRWNLETGRHELLAATKPGDEMEAAFGRQARVALTLQHRAADRGRRGGSRRSLCGRAVLWDLGARTSRELPEFGDCVAWGVVALDPSGSVAATGSLDGSIRIGRLSAGEPHLLLGHWGAVSGLAISPDLRWVASTGEDNTLRLWPMQDLDQAPLHTLPHDELVGSLRSLTNLRAVRDPKSSTGWSIELGPFPGWKNIPSW
jgi:WD40 repeat protein